MLSRALKMAFWVLYDHLGKLVLANLIWAAAVLAPGLIGWAALTSGQRPIALVIGAPAMVLACGVMLPVITAGLAHMIKGLIETQDGSVLDLFSGIRLYGLRALGIGLFYGVACSSLIVSVWFYATKLRDTAPWIGYTISALALWCLAFAGLMAMLVMPALVQKKAPVFATLRLAALLVLDNPLFCIGLALQFMVLIGLSLMPPVLLLLSGSAATVLGSSAYEMLARKYAALSKSGVALDDHATGSLRAISRKSAIDFGDEHDDYLNRGFRDFLFPWKG